MFTLLAAEYTEELDPSFALDTQNQALSSSGTGMPNVLHFSKERKY